MSQRAIIAALVIGWTFAAVTLWMSGAYVERLHRYEGCTLVSNMAPEPFWVCPARSDSPARPGRSEGEVKA